MGPLSGPSCLACSMMKHTLVSPSALHRDRVRSRFSVVETDYFINRCSEFIASTLALEDGIGGVRTFTVKVKHNEPFQYRKRKYQVTQAWTAIQGEYARLHQGLQLTLKVSHDQGLISCEGEDLIVRSIWAVSEMGANGAFAHSSMASLKLIPGFDDTTPVAIRAAIAIATQR
jgi:hypothetical protein